MRYVNAHTVVFDQVGTEQEKVDDKIAKALMAKGKQDTARTWSKDEQHWVSMVLNLSHREGSFGVTSNRITIRVHCLAECIVWLGTFSDSKQAKWLGTLTSSMSPRWRPSSSRP
jgi:hypothetical protein